MSDLKKARVLKKTPPKPDQEPDPENREPTNILDAIRNPNKKPLKHVEPPPDKPPAAKTKSNRPADPAAAALFDKMAAIAKANGITDDEGKSQSVWVDSDDEDQ